MGKVHAPGKFCVGLTGGIGSGKSLVAELFAAQGASIIDTDQIAHQLTAAAGAAMPRIRAEFGDEFVAPDGAMDRKKMREHVFSSPGAKKKLEAILHPLIRSESELAAASAQGTYPIFVVPLLVESGMWRQRVSRVLVVDCPEQLQIERVMSRNSFSEVEVKAIIAMQASRSERLAAADDIIVNDRGLTELIPEIARLHAIYCALA